MSVGWARHSMMDSRGTLADLGKWQREGPSLEEKTATCFFPFMTVGNDIAKPVGAHD